MKAAADGVTVTTKRCAALVFEPSASVAVTVIVAAPAATGLRANCPPVIRTRATVGADDVAA